MKLYHATQLDNKDNILTTGLESVDADCLHNQNQEIELSGVFGFVDIDDAHDFAIENNLSQDYAIFSFDADGCIDDPEYDGEAKFLETSEYTKAELVFSC